MLGYLLINLFKVQIQKLIAELTFCKINIENVSFRTKNTLKSVKIKPSHDN